MTPANSPDANCNDQLLQVFRKTNGKSVLNIVVEEFLEKS